MIGTSSLKSGHFSAFIRQGASGHYSKHKTLLSGGVNLPWTLCPSGPPWLREEPGCLSSLPPAYLLNIAPPAQDLPLGTVSPQAAPPQHPLGRPSSCSNAGNPLLLFGLLQFPLSSLPLGKSVRDLGVISCCVEWCLKAEMSCVHIISCRVHVRGKSNKLGSRGSEQGREVGCILLI